MAEENREALRDSLPACLREFTDFPLFRPVTEGADHEFLDAPHVIDIHGLLEGLRELAVFLMLDRLLAGSTETWSARCGPRAWRSGFFPARSLIPARRDR